MHTCPAESDLRGVDAGSGVTSGSGQRAQCQEMPASTKLILGSKGLINIDGNIIFGAWIVARYSYVEFSASLHMT